MNGSAYGSPSVAAVLLNNTNGTAQTAIDFAISGTTYGRVRSDYAGNMNYSTFYSGVHGFSVGGDVGVGTSIFKITSSGATLESGALYIGSANLSGGGASSYGRSLVLSGGATGGYTGLVLNDGGFDCTMMSNGTANCGMYLNGGTAGWMFYDTPGSGTTNFVRAMIAPSFTPTSDARLKDNVETIAGALDKVSQLRGVTFTWNGKSHAPGTTSTGLIAQEVEKVIPEVVSEFQISQKGTAELGETYKGVNYGALVGLLVEAVKEEKSKREALEARLSALEAKAA